MDLFYRNRGRFRPVLVVLTVVLLGGILYCIDFRSLRKTSSETLESATETTKVPTNDPSKSIATSRLETGSSLAPPESNNTLCLVRTPNVLLSFFHFHHHGLPHRFGYVCFARAGSRL